MNIKTAFFKSTLATLLLLSFSLSSAQAESVSITEAFENITNSLPTVEFNDTQQLAFLFGPRVPKKMQTSGKRMVVFNPRAFSWAAYDERGRLVKSGRAAGGSRKCPESNRSCRTPVGMYKIYRIGDKYCASNTYPLGRGGAKMPYCMFFHDGSALHGSPGKVPKVHASHGCVRLNIQDAAWLHRNFVTYNTYVLVRPY